MGTRVEEVKRVARLVALCLVVGLALVAVLPTSAPSAADQAVGEPSVGAQAFSDRQRVSLDLDINAIVVHALIEYVMAPQHTGLSTQHTGLATQHTGLARRDTPVAASSTQRVVAPVPAAAPAAAAAPSVESVPSAPASTPVLDHVRRGERVLAQMPVTPASVGFTIEFLPGRSGYGGLTYPDSRRIEVYVDSGWSDAYLAHVVAHEIGHAVDMARNSRSDHERWRDARGIPQTTRWWADPYTSDFATPGGDFAECFAAWAVGTASTRSQFGSCAGTGALVSELVWG